MNDGTIDYIPKHKVELMGLPLRCQRCNGNNAHWAADDQAVCHLCLLELSDQDESYKQDLFDALISPELLEVSLNEVRIRVFGSTSVAPLCKMLNTLSERYPNVGPDTEIDIELWQARGIGGPARGLTFEGEGWYTIESTTIKCHAPLIRLARAPRGRMAGFMKLLNDHSMMVRKRAEEEAEYGKAIDVEEEPDA